MLKCGGSFSEILMLGKNLQEISGYVSRIHDVITVLDAKQDVQLQPVQDAAVEHIAFKGFTLKTPVRELAAGQLASADEEDEQKRESLDHQLVRNLDFVIQRGQSVMVTGPNGVGKTSLFRSLAGLWPVQTGSITTPSYKQVMWLPQRAYMVLGTLRDQVVYPERLGMDSSQDARIHECLVKAARDSDETTKALNLVHGEWNKILSGGERQRIAFARLYFHKPLFAVLDECTSAVNSSDEFMLYENLTQSEGVTVISIAHRLALRKFHQFELEIRLDPEQKEKKNWSLKRITN
jgi:ABC-type uncharacterized transport system fused permease/ATPase subunit